MGKNKIAFIAKTNYYVNIIEKQLLEKNINNVKVFPPNSKIIKKHYKLIIKEIVPNKEEALFLDIAGTIDEHGFPTQRHDFNKVRPPARKKAEVEFSEIECHNCGYNTQIKNCKRNVEESKHITITRWYCPLCDEVIKENSVDNKKVKRLKEIQDYTNISKVTGSDVHEMINAIRKDNDYKQGWVSYVADDWKRSKHIRDGMKLIYKKWSLEMITLDTALRNITKLRSEYEKA